MNAARNGRILVFICIYVLIMNIIRRITEQEIRNISANAARRIVSEQYDDGLEDELAYVGATGGATEKEIEGWTEDLWINLNKTLQNANWLFNKTRDEKYARIMDVVAGALDFFPPNAHRIYMQVDYDPSDGWGG